MGMSVSGGGRDGYYEDEFGWQPAGGQGEPTGDPATEDPRAFARRFEDTGELALEDDVRLPWLEGDDEEDYAETGYNALHVVVLVLLGLVGLAAIVGGIWWMQRDKPDADLVADGATIAAPSGPYKTRPANPGGEVVAGTGDTSFAVAEGQTRQVNMDDRDAPAAPAPSTSPKAAAGASAGESAPTGDTSGVGVQVGAYSTKDAAEKGWSKLSQQYAALSGKRHRIVEGQADIGTVYRLQALEADAGGANGLCASLKGAGLSCQVKR